jgi:hypothetical protein
VKPVDLTLEREIQADVIELYTRLGCIVKPTSGGRRRGTRNAPGLPDLYVFPPLRRRPSGLADLIAPRTPFWHETKRPGGKQSPAQREWQIECAYRGVGYVVGGTEAAIIYLRSIGLIADVGARQIPLQKAVHATPR